MGDNILNNFLKLRGLIPNKPTKEQKEIKEKNKEYIQVQNGGSFINKIIDEKPKEKYVIKYFRERIKELDERKEQED